MTSDPKPRAGVDASRFLSTIQLTRVTPSAGHDAFTASTQYVPWPKAYGGDLVAQAASAATATIEDDRGLQSIHSYFMRPVDVESVVRYEVERLRDGRRYATRSVRAMQDQKTVFVALASFHVHETGPEFALAQPHGIPDADSLPSPAEVVAAAEIPEALKPAAEYWSGGMSFEMRHVPGPIYFSADPATEPAAQQAVWLRSSGPIPTDAATQRIALAYACDYSILESLLRVHGSYWTAPGLATASLDHAMWFHRDGNLNDWVLYAQEAISEQCNRGLVQGRFFDVKGRLLATVMQEGMIRGIGK